MLIKLREVVWSPETSTPQVREIYLEKEHVVLLVNDTKISELNESAKALGPISKVVINTVGLHREIFVLGAAAEIRSKLNAVSGKTILNG